MPNYTGRRRTLSDAEIVELYRKGLDAETVGIAAGCSGTTVLVIVRAAGEPIRQRGKGSTGKRKPIALSDEEIIERYQNGASGPEIAEAAGCTAEVIYRTLRNAKVPRRTPYSHSRTRNRSL
jgi:DNA invertase Pin-like site-specific DNA recombinase